MDRTTIAPALVVAVLAVVMIFVIPAIDAAVPAGHRVRPGDRVGLLGDVEFTPTVGWSLTSGILVGEAPRSGGYPPMRRSPTGASR
jgi:hypothetical protein